MRTSDFSHIVCSTCGLHDNDECSNPFHLQMKSVLSDAEDEIKISNKNCMTDQQIIDIARQCHEANKVWCQINGDDSQKHWDEAEQWQRDSAIKGVWFRINNPDAKEDSQHNAWMEDKLKQGWVYGNVKDPEKKTHPCIVPFEELPLFQQLKDRLFCAIVDAMVVKRVAADGKQAVN